MLYIEIYHGDVISADTCVHVGRPISTVVKEAACHPFCDGWHVQADGDELELIRDKLSNIPMADRRVVKWYGEDARFIIMNLDT